MPSSPPHQAHHGASRLRGTANWPRNQPGTASTSRITEPRVKFSHAVVKALPEATPTRPLIPDWMASEIPASTLSTTGRTTRASVCETRPSTATSTPTTARIAAAARPVVTGSRPAGPIPNRSTPIPLAVCPPTTATVHSATPASGTAYDWQNTKSPPMNPPTHWYQRIPASVRAERNRTRPARIRRVTTRAMLSTRVPVRKLHSAASRPCPKTVASSPFIRDWTDSSAPPTKASTAHSRRDDTSVREVAGAGEVHRQPGRRGPLDDDVVADGAAR